ncbi:hypothetical protein NDU88_002055 [Pleurodeles waltl]|uniref:Secreted protein n=1 Tax=Pleurodeles waltl TaxID=8319 RepID=A0AAV7VBF0_PLEWA|nr:hypothetical protein NDU88_002055 [Pleurodeles waltl]
MVPRALLRHPLFAAVFRLWPPPSVPGGPPASIGSFRGCFLDAALGTPCTTITRAPGSRSGNPGAAAPLRLVNPAHAGAGQPPGTLCRFHRTAWHRSAVPAAPRQGSVRLDK